MQLIWLPTKDIWKFTNFYLADLGTKIQEIHQCSIDGVGLLFIGLPIKGTLEFVSLSLTTLLIKIRPVATSIVVEIHHFIGQLKMDIWKFVNLSWKMLMIKILPTITQSQHQEEEIVEIMSQERKKLHFIWLLKIVNFQFVNSYFKICQTKK